MKKKYGFVWLIPLMVLTCVFWGCAVGGGEETSEDGGGGKTMTPVKNGLEVRPGIVAVVKGKSKQFTAKLTGDPGSPAWSVSNGAVSQIDPQTGLLEVGEGETATILVVTARASGNRYGTAIVRIIEDGDLPLENGIIVTPGIVTVGKGFSQNFTAELSATGGDATVTWNVSSEDGSSFTGSVLTVHGDETAEKLIVTAATSDNKKIGTAIVYVDGNGGSLPELGGPFPESKGIYVSPPLLTLDKGEVVSAHFTATGADSVTWTLVDAEGAAITTSSITTDGVLEVALDETAEKIVVRASGVNAENTDVSGTAIVTVRGNESTSDTVVDEGLHIEPQDGTVERGFVQAFSAQDESENAVTSGLSWRVFGGRSGTEMIGNVLKIAVNETANYLTVRGEAPIGQSGTIVYGTAVVEVVDPTEGTPSHPITDQGITVQSPSAYVIQGKTRQFTQTGAASVKWFVYGNSAEGTTINGNGLLEADANEPVGITLTVWAISTTGNSAYGTAQVTVRAPVTLGSMKTVTVSGLKSDSTWWNGIAYGEDVFVIGSNDGKIFRSEDRGESWTQVNFSGFSSNSNYIGGIVYGEGVFVAVGKNGKIAYSTDAGTTWTAVTSSPFGSTTISSVRYLEGKFFAVGDDNNKMAYSTNGIAWTSAAGGFGGNSIRDIAYGAGKFVSVGFKNTMMSWSSNGIDNWTTVSGLGNVFTDNIMCIVYADGKFVAGAGNGSNGNLGYSVSGDSGWALGGSLGSGKSVRRMAYGAGKFIAVSYGNRIAYSGDGIDWDYLDTSPCGGVAYGDGRFVIVQDGKVLIIGD